MADTDQTRQQQREDMMLRGSLPRVITKMALPSIISFLITSIYNLADTYFVSDLGESAQAAISVNASLDQIIMMAGSMLAVGAASYISRLLGAKEKDKANQVLSTAFFTAMIFGGIVTLLGVTFLHPMVRLLGATDTCEQFAVEYATYVLLVAPFMAANFVMNQCLRAEGSALLSMVGMGFGGILNCFLDPIFIFELNMGVKGASLATAISKLVSFAILVFPYLTRRSVLHLTIRKFRPTKDIVTQVVTVGSSSMFRSGLAVVSAIVLNNIAGQISDAVLAGVGVSTKVMMFPFGVILGFGTGFQPVAGFNWGARRYDRVKESYRFASRAAILGALAMGLTLAALADPLIGLFAKSDQSAEMLAVGALCIRLQCLVLPIHGWVAVVNMFCAGLGNARGALLLSTSRQGTCFLPIVYPMAWLWGTNGVAAVQAVADVLTLLLAVPLIRRVKARIQAAADAQAIEGSALAGGETPVTDPVLSSLLRINRQRIKTLRRTVLNPNGYVGVMHLIVLYAGRHPGASQEDVVAFFALDKASVARGARRLEELGHLRREQDPVDRRQYRLFLTEGGEEMRRIIDRAHLDFQRQLSQGVSPEDWAALAALLERLEENCGREGDG